MSAQLAVNLLDPHSLLAHFGAIGVFLVLVAETGLLVGLFLPGDSLLFTAGLLATTGARSSLHLSLPAVLVAAAAGAIVGAQLGYWLGRRAGPALLGAGRTGSERPYRRRLRAGIEQTGAHLERYGPAKAIVLGRFVPVVRTIINPVAGVTRVDPRTFVLAQVGGGLVWSLGVTLAGYALGSRVPNIDRYLLPIVAVVVVLSLIPVALEIRRARRRPAPVRERIDG